MKALIFGASGQDGRFLNDLLSYEGLIVYNSSRSSGDFVGDISNFDFVYSLIEKLQPDYIFHFAAKSSTSHMYLFENNESIFQGTLNILESVNRLNAMCKIFLSGSAVQFKNDGLPINENSEFDLSSAYSLVRINSVLAGRYYRENFGLKVYIGYLFNHDSEFRGDQHVNKMVTSVVRSIANGSKEKLVIGDINVCKEFNYAGDIVKAIWILINQDHFFEAVIGSGKYYSIKDWIEYCFSKYGLNWIDYVEYKSDYKSEYKVLYSDPGRIKEMGWAPLVDMRDLADIMLREI